MKNVANDTTKPFQLTKMQENHLSLLNSVLIELRSLLLWMQ